MKKEAVEFEVKKKDIGRRSGSVEDYNEYAI